jgi:hypothetical protein
MLLVTSCLNILYINTIHVGVHYWNYNTIICSYLWELFWLWSSLFILPFDFLTEQPRCSELVMTFYTVYFYVSLVRFSLFYGFIHLLHFCIWLRCVTDCNWLVFTAWWWLYKSKHVAHCHTIKINKLIIHTECEWDFDSCCVETEKTITKYSNETSGFTNCWEIID